MSNKQDEKIAVFIPEHRIDDKKSSQPSMEENQPQSNPVNNNGISKPVPIPQANEYANPQQNTLSEEKYNELIDTLNAEEIDRNYIFIFGIPGSGKTHVIASILDFMNRCDQGCVSLDEDYANNEARNLYARMQAIYEKNPDSLQRNQVGEFKKLHVIFTKDEKDYKITFLDIPGEDCNRISGYSGKLPQYLEAILESRVNCMFLLVYDSQDLNSQEKQKNEGGTTTPHQSIVLASFYNKLLNIQTKKEQRFKKLILITKWDKVNKKIYEDNNKGVKKYIENNLSSLSGNFFSKDERNLNATTAFSLGRFSKEGELLEPDEQYAGKVFEWIFNNLSETPLYKKPSLVDKALNYLKKGTVE